LVIFFFSMGSTYLFSLFWLLPILVFVYFTVPSIPWYGDTLLHQIIIFIFDIFSTLIWTPQIFIFVYFSSNDFLCISLHHEHKLTFCSERNFCLFVHCS
jgi:hypothetical protein